MSAPPVLFDLERCVVGPPEWDLVSTAIKPTGFNWVTAEEYRAFCKHYRHDVTTLWGSRTLHLSAELR
ncbi:hypothetical protein NUG22_36510 [Saccharothrix longispora]|nr:hypothetical protein [Saccharothrix longispora]